jgi:hypothetical protein
MPGSRTGLRAVLLPPPSPKSGPTHARRERERWLRHLLAWAIGCGLLIGGVVFVGDSSRTEAFTTLVTGWTVALAIDFVWSFSYTFWPRREMVGGGNS